MSVTPLSYDETSVPVGALCIALGVTMVLSHHYLGVFTSWTWAIVFGSAWLIMGSLFLYPDIRLYQYDRPPLEQLTDDIDDL